MTSAKATKSHQLRLCGHHDHFRPVHPDPQDPCTVCLNSSHDISDYTNTFFILSRCVPQPCPEHTNSPSSAVSNGRGGAVFVALRKDTRSFRRWRFSQCVRLNWCISNHRRLPSPLSETFLHFHPVCLSRRRPLWEKHSVRFLFAVLRSKFRLFSTHPKMAHHPDSAFAKRRIHS